MERSDLIKIFVLLITLAFLLEMFQISGAKNYTQGDGTGPTPEGSPTPGELLFGLAGANATVQSYPDGIIVVKGPGAGSDANLSSSISAMQAEGKVSYSNSADQGSVSVVLAPGANITELGTRIALAYPAYSLSSRAQVLLPASLAFQTDSGNVTAPVKTKAFLQMEPLVPAGESIEVVVGAMVGNGSANGMEVQVAQKEGVALVPAEVSSLSDQWRANATYPWEERGINATQLGEGLKARYPNSSVVFDAPGYIKIYNATEEQAGRMRNLSYINFIIGTTASVDAGFTNRSVIEEDVRGITGGNATVEFPEGELLANITSPELDEAFVRGLVGQNATIVRLGTLVLGRLVEINGRQFIAPSGITLVRALPLNASVGDNVTSAARIRVAGMRIISAG